MSTSRTNSSRSGARNEREVYTYVCIRRGEDGELLSIRSARATRRRGEREAERGRTLGDARVGQNLDGDLGPLPVADAHAPHRARPDLLLDVEALGRDFPLAAAVPAVEPADRPVLRRVVQRAVAREPRPAAGGGRLRELAGGQLRELAAQRHPRRRLLGRPRFGLVRRLDLERAAARADGALELLKACELVGLRQRQLLNHRVRQVGERRVAEPGGDAPGHRGVPRAPSARPCRKGA